jgi:hypothetical protein
MCDSTCAAFIANVVPTPSRARLRVPISLCCLCLRQTLAAPHLHGSQRLWVSRVGGPPQKWGCSPLAPPLCAAAPQGCLHLPHAPSIIRFCCKNHRKSATRGFRPSTSDHWRPLMDKPPLFKWHPFTGEIILCGVRWYLRSALRYRDDEELLRERGGAVAYTTVFRWGQRYAPEFDKRVVMFM